MRENGLVTAMVSYAQKLGRRIPRRLGSFQLDSSGLGGLLLVASAMIALVGANSAWSDSYASLWSTQARIGIGDYGLDKPVLLWVNDLLMAIFFLLVGLEIKREALAGALSSVRKAALPVVAAVGGMAVPALVFVAFTWGRPEMSGWAIPAATDIAFALGIIALLGSRVPTSLKVFLTAVAVVDDLGAVIIIALFYSGTLSMVALFAAAACVVGLVALNKIGYRRRFLYILLGAVLWLAVLKSGLHATIAGVVLAMAIPRDLIPSWEHGLKPWVFYAIVPIFALANAGVSLDASVMAELNMGVALGVGLGLVLGKSIGIMAFSYGAVRLGLADKPSTHGWGQIFGAAWLAGIGFTMSLFIADLAFGGQLAALASAKVGLLAGSAVAGTVGTVLLVVFQDRSEQAAASTAPTSSPITSSPITTEQAP